MPGTVPAFLTAKADNSPPLSLHVDVEGVRLVRAAILSRGWSIGAANSVEELIAAIKTMRPPEPTRPAPVVLSDARTASEPEDDFEDDFGDGMTIGGGVDAATGSWLAEGR